MALLIVQFIIYGIYRQLDKSYNTIDDSRIFTFFKMLLIFPDINNATVLFLG